MAPAAKSSRLDTDRSDRKLVMTPDFRSSLCVARGFARIHAIALLAVAGVAAQAQSDAETTSANRRLTIVPTFSASMMLTDNVHLSANDRQSDLVTTLSPGIRATSNSGRIRGFLDYSLNALGYARESSSNDIQHALNATATIEAIENWAFIDVAGAISQQAVSAYGTQSSDNALASANRTAVSTYRLSPYIRGQLGDLVNYETRLTYTDSGNGSSSAANSVKSSEALVRLNGVSSLRAIGWSIDATRQAFDYDTAGTVHSDRLRGVLTYTVTPELRVTAIGGGEAQNFETPDTQTHGTSGWGVDWSPTDRTRLSATREQRFFGNSHLISFEHRTPRTVWRYSDSRDLTTGFEQLRLGSLGTVYDLYFAQYASLVPDPVLRATFVNALLRSRGIAPNTVVLGGSLASAALVQRSQDLSFAWIGLRDTLTVMLSQGRGERADRVVVVTDDFANGNIVRQRGFSLGLAHRLTPQSSLNVTASLQTSTGSVDTRSSKLRSLLVGWTARLGVHTSASLSGRHTRGNSLSEPYTESAVIATVSLQF
jgi:uncharacterized protein (PEP-CTERM system associated)